MRIGADISVFKALVCFLLALPGGVLTAQPVTSATKLPTVERVKKPLDMDSPCIQPGYENPGRRDVALPRLTLNSTIAFGSWPHPQAVPYPPVETWQCHLSTAAFLHTSVVSAAEFSAQVSSFLGKELSAHLADVQATPGHDLFDPPPNRVVGVPTSGEFSWGTFLRALASYSELSGQTTFAGRNLSQFVAKAGLIEARQGGKAFAQMYAAMALRSFGTDLRTNPVWQALTPQEQSEWRSLLDPSRFYDRKTRHVINLPENYFGVAARVVSMDYQLGIISDRQFVDDVLNRAAEQFTSGALYSDDNIPTGRYDRYSNEYARYVYEAAENAGRQELMRALELALKTQMRTWWDLLSPDGYGYPWGRSLGVISYIDTMEICAFLGKHPQFRPAALDQLAAAYYVAWQSLMKNFQPERHLLNVLGFGRGNYSYITAEREWQQTTAFLGKVAGAHKAFMETLRAEHVTAFPAQLDLPEVARFQYFRAGPRPAGVWLVRQKDIRFVLPITTGTKPGVSDYLPAPYDLPGFAPPVEQLLPTITPYIELADGSIIVAGDGADEIHPSDDGHSLRALWRKWVVVGGKPAETVDPGLVTEIVWSFAGDQLVRSEKISSAKPVVIKRFWAAIPSTATDAFTSLDGGRRTDTLKGEEGDLAVSLDQSSFPLQVWVQATGNSPMGKGSRGSVPLVLNLEAKDLAISVDKGLEWRLSLRSLRTGADGEDTRSTAHPGHNQNSTTETQGFSMHSTGLRKFRRRDVALPRLTASDLNNASQNPRQSSNNVCLTQNSRGLKSETWRCHVSTLGFFTPSQRHGENLVSRVTQRGTARNQNACGAQPPSAAFVTPARIDTKRNDFGS